MVPPVQAKPSLPSLEENVRYTGDHPVTRAIREHLATVDSTIVATSDLTQTEWLAALYTNAGRPLPWRTLNITQTGYWHDAIKGQVNVVIGIEPRNQAIMEWTDDDRRGRAALVTRVTPAATITVHELGFPLPGVLTEHTLTQADWKELRPVFISVQ